MGLITGNTNEFVVYLTDKGRETFFNGGLQDKAYYFSLSDTESNYNVLNDDTFNPHLTNQNIITITNTNKTTNGLKEVFTQLSNRGSIVDNKYHNHGLFSINDAAQRDYILYNPDLNTITGLDTTNYKEIGEYRQFNLNGLNGLYLRTEYPLTITLNDLIRNFDLFPIDNLDLNKYQLINSKIQKKTLTTDLGFVGSNAKTKSTNNVNYSKIIKKDELVLGENYHVSFEYYFRFVGGKNLDYNPTGTSENLNFSIYVMLGSNKLKMTLSDLQQYRTTGATSQFTSDIIFRRLDDFGVFGSSLLPQAQLVYLTSGDTQVNINYSKKEYTARDGGSRYVFNIVDDFDSYNNSPNGYNFKVKASLDLSEFFTQNRCLNNKDFTILVEYSKLANKFIHNDYVTTTYTY